MSLRTTTTGILTAALVTAGATVPAHAAAPERWVETIDFTIPEHGMYTEACGFPVSLHVSGDWLVRLWTDEAGHPVREFRNYRFDGVLSANGKTIEGRSRGPETAVFNADGSTTVHVRGIVNRQVPGGGTVKLSWGSGITVWPADEGMEVVVDPTGGPESLQPLCDYLAP
jgi:hypothetical protein